MRTLWKTSDGRQEKMVAPLSLVVSAFSLVKDVRKTVTPDLKPGESELFLLDLGGGKNRLGCSALAQVFNQVGNEPPDLDDPALVVRFFDAIQELVERGLILAYHDRSDGGLFVTLAEMAFGGRRGLRVNLDPLGGDELAALFSEEIGAVIQVAREHVGQAHDVLTRHGVAAICHAIGRTTAEKTVEILHKGQKIFSERVSALNRLWSELTYHMQSRRDNPECIREEFESIQDEQDPGMNFTLTYDPGKAFTVSAARPRMAILREQGINGQVEMAAAFDRAGFESVDVHMTDLLSGRVNLDGFSGLVACGGFSYGDVLGAGAGWAKSILFNEELKEKNAQLLKDYVGEFRFHPSEYSSITDTMVYKEKKGSEPAFFHVSK
jgi:phosphoribosylformylglycinamidine synthase